MPKVREWHFMTSNYVVVSPSEVSETKGVRLLGKVFGDERHDPLTTEFQDGHRIETSFVKEVDWEEGTVRTETGTLYELDGDANEDYVKFLSKDGKASN